MAFKPCRHARHYTLHRRTSFGHQTQTAAHLRRNGKHPSCMSTLLAVHPAQEMPPYIPSPALMPRYSTANFDPRFSQPHGAPSYTPFYTPLKERFRNILCRTHFVKHISKSSELKIQRRNGERESLNQPKGRARQQHPYFPTQLIASRFLWVAGKKSEYNKEPVTVEENGMPQRRRSILVMPKSVRTRFTVLFGARMPTHNSLITHTNARYGEHKLAKVDYTHFKSLTRGQNTNNGISLNLGCYFLMGTGF